MTPYNHVGMRKFVRNGHMGRPWQLPALRHGARTVNFASTAFPTLPPVRTNRGAAPKT